MGVKNVAKMNQLEISKDFTIDDIHKIREYQYVVRKKLLRIPKMPLITKIRLNHF